VIWIEATRKNEEIARTILNIFGESNCTVAESKEILNYVGSIIGIFATVQKTDNKLFEVKNS